LLRSLAKRAPIEPIKDNICQGNSLISGTEKELKSYFGKDWQAKHPFNWQDEFKDIMASGGFDVVIGNPPYGIVFDTNMKAYLEHKYPVFRRNYDFFVAFIQKGLQVLKNGGFFSFILPNTFLGGQYFEDLREYIFSEAKILKIVDFGISRVFLEPNVFNVIILLQKESEAPKRKNNTVMLVNGLSITPNDSQVDFTTEPRIQSRLPSLGWRSIDPIVRKCIDKHLKLVDMAYVKDVGLNYWTIGRKKTRGGSIADRILYEGERKNKQDLPYLKGRDTERYYYAFNDRWLRHNYQEFLVPEVDIFGYGSDFLLNGSKIIYRQTADSIVATIDNHPYLVDKTLHAVRIKDASAKDFSLEYLLGILNSKLATYVYRDFAKEEGRLFAQVKTFIMKELPIRQIDFTNQSEKQAHDNIVAHVEKILELNKKLAPIREIYSDEREELLKEIAKTDKEIDSLVYDLYGLTEAEIKIVEANA